MKKSTILTFAMLATTLSGFATDTPAEYYVCGAMTEFKSSDSDSSFVLTDDDKDGIFTGEFEIPQDKLIFKILSAKCDWDDALNVYGMTSRATAQNLYSDKVWTKSLGKGNYFDNFVYIHNWEGGKVKISFCAATSQLSLQAPGQPTFTMPDNLYMTGMFNGWMVPKFPEGRDFALTPAGTDENYTVYKGSFNIPAGQLEFKIFTAPDDWDSASYLGTYSYPQTLYSNRKDYFYFTLNGENNGKVSNWMGGTLNVTAKLKYTEEQGFELECLLEGPEQPATENLPDTAYIVGNFNNWQLPSDDNLNGAIKLTFNQDIYDTYAVASFNAAHLTFPSGDVEFEIYYKEKKESRTWNHIIGTEFPPITLYSNNPYNQGYYSISNLTHTFGTGELSVIGKNPVVIRNWDTNSTLDIYYYFDRGEISLIAQNAPQVKIPENLYAIVTIDDNDPVIVEDLFYAGGKGKKISVLFSTEKSINPKAENVYGIDDQSFAFDTKRYYSMIQGGKPVIREFSNYGQAYCSINWANSVITSDGEEIATGNSPEVLYIIGNVSVEGYNYSFISPSESNRDLFEKYFKFDKIEDGVFEGTFYVSPSKEMNSINSDDASQFRFVYKLCGWTGGDGHIGAGLRDFYCVPFEFSDTWSYTGNLYMDGLSNWGILNWGGGYVKMRVNTNDRTVFFVDCDGASIETIRVDADSNVRYFDLYGREVSNPEKGLFIKVSNNHSEKILIY